MAQRAGGGSQPPVCKVKIRCEGLEMARLTGLEPATSGVTGRHSNRLSYNRLLNRQHRIRTGVRGVLGGRIRAVKQIAPIGSGFLPAHCWRLIKPETGGMVGRERLELPTSSV